MRDTRGLMQAPPGGLQHAAAARRPSPAGGPGDPTRCCPLPTPSHLHARSSRTASRSSITAWWLVPGPWRNLGREGRREGVWGGGKRIEGRTRSAPPPCEQLPPLWRDLQPSRARVACVRTCGRRAAQGQHRSACCCTSPHPAHSTPCHALQPGRRTLPPCTPRAARFRRSVQPLAPAACRPAQRQPTCSCGPAPRRRCTPCRRRSWSWRRPAACRGHAQRPPRTRTAGPTAARQRRWTPDNSKGEATRQARRGVRRCGEQRWQAAAVAAVIATHSGNQPASWHTRGQAGSAPLRAPPALPPPPLAAPVAPRTTTLPNAVLRLLGHRDGAEGRAWPQGGQPGVSYDVRCTGAPVGPSDGCALSVGSSEVSATLCETTGRQCGAISTAGTRHSHRTSSWPGHQSACKRRHQLCDPHTSRPPELHSRRWRLWPAPRGLWQPACAQCLPAA